MRRLLSDESTQVLLRSKSSRKVVLRLRLLRPEAARELRPIVWAPSSQSAEHVRSTWYTSRDVFERHLHWNFPAPIWSSGNRRYNKQATLLGQASRGAECQPGLDLRHDCNHRSGSPFLNRRDLRGLLLQEVCSLKPTAS